MTIDIGNPVTFNDPALMERMLPTLRRVAGADKVSLARVTTTAEDFALYQQEIPGLMVFLGATPPSPDMAAAAPNHSPQFFLDESTLPVGVKTLANLAVDWLAARR